MQQVVPRKNFENLPEGQNLRENFFKMRVERAVETEIMSHFHGVFNTLLFGDQLGVVEFRTVSQDDFLGMFHYDEVDADAIVLDAKVFEGWEIFSDVLLHEMCHQMQRLVEGAKEEPVHGPVFLKWALLCECSPVGWEEDPVQKEM